MDAAAQPRPGHAITQRLQERLVSRRCAAHDQGLGPGVTRQRLQHRVDKHVRPLLAPNAPVASDGESIGQPEPAPERAPVGRRVERRRVDTVQDHPRGMAQIGRGPLRGGDHGVHARDQPPRVAGVAALRRGGEHELQALAQHVAQDEAEQHLGVAPRMPHATLVPGHREHRPERHPGDVRRQTRSGRRDSNRAGLHRQQSRHGRGDAREAPLQVRRDHVDTVERQR